MIGYDCGSRNLNVTTLSLLGIGECRVPSEDVNVKQIYLQLLQVNAYRHTQVVQCKLDVDRTVRRCGMHSHDMDVHMGRVKYVQEIGASECLEMHKTGTYRLGGGAVVRGLKVNHTVSHTVNLAGTNRLDGSCTGVEYHDPYGSWEKVFVKAIMDFTLTSYTAQVLLENDKIHLASGQVCTLSEGSCLDVRGGYTFWSPIPVDRCGFDKYGVLYEGLAQKMTDGSGTHVETVYTLSTSDVTFGLTARGYKNVCGYNLIRTEHPKLVILETTKGESFAQNERVSVNNLDIFAYVNSKFVYVEKHIRNQMKSLYRDVVTQRCDLERSTLKNSLSIAASSPDEFAYRLMKGPGYMAVVSGEVVHIIKCIPIEVMLRHDENCYSELPVSRTTPENKEPYFMSPRTHILKKKGTQITCNALIPAYYRFGDGWLKIMPRPKEAKDPITIQPNSQETWKYINAGDLATSGIYTEQEINELRERIMFPVERGAILNDIAREMRGEPVADRDGSIMRLLDEDTVLRIAESAWAKMWGHFMSFGTAASGFIAVIIIFHLIKGVIDVFIRGYALHGVFGWSFHLLGALWSSVAHCLLLTAQNTKPDQDVKPREAVEMAETGLYPPLGPHAITNLENEGSKQEPSAPESRPNHRGYAPIPHNLV